MGDKTGIAWTDHTFNPWIGCTKVSQGCAHCYAERDNKRYAWVNGWGKGAERRRTSAANWKKPLQWAKDAVASGVKRRVFCASLADVFDAEVPNVWRMDLWGVIEETLQINRVLGKDGAGLEWLILTKRPENIEDMIPIDWFKNPSPFIRIGVTAEDQENWNKRVPILLDAWIGKNFISVEPMIGDVIPDRKVDWIICGCESGPGARRMIDWWVEDLLFVCNKDLGIPFFLKQRMIDDKLVKEPVFSGRQWLEFPD